MGDSEVTAFYQSTAYSEFFFFYSFYNQATPFQQLTFTSATNSF